MPDPDHPYVSRGGLKLAAALDAFGVDPAGMTCADLGCNVGGFTDCLLRRGAARVYAADTGYGTLAWKLRNDTRVLVLERTNAVHFEPRQPDGWPKDLREHEACTGFAGCGLVCIDLGWTPQRHAVPAALRWLRGGGDGRIITLIKPHYEHSAAMGPVGKRRKTGVLTDDLAERVLHETLEELPALGVRVVRHIRSPLRGGAGKGKTGNVEYLALLERRQGSSENEPRP